MFLSKPKKLNLYDYFCQIIGIIFLISLEEVKHMRLIFHYMKRYKKIFFINILAILMVASAELGIPMVLAKIIDDGILVKNLDQVYKLSLWLVLVALLGSIGNIVVNFCSSRTSTYILKDLRNDVFGKIQTYSPSDLQDLGVSTLLTRTTTDVFNIVNFITTFYRAAVLAPILMVIAITLILMRTPQLSIGIILVMPVIIIVLTIIILISKTLSIRQQRYLDKLNLITRENLTGVRVIRAFRKSQYEAKRFEETNQIYTKNAAKMFKIMVSIEPSFFFLLNVSNLLLLWLGAKYIDTGNLSLGQIVEFLNYQFQVMYSVLTFSLLFILFPKTMVSANRLKSILNKVPTIINNDNVIKEVPKLGIVEFDHVTFKYSNADKAILNDITLTAKKGEMVAFVGSTGSGKSTLINLIPRLYDVTEGAIRIDGIDIKDYDLKELRDRISFILQKALLFQGTIESNISFGKDNATRDEIIKAAKVAQAHNFIMEKENGYQSYVSELGSNFSGGQKQRISIARAIVKNPEIYIFDDSFSALDYKTDFELRKALFEHAKESIVFVVAQRLNSIINADKIVVLNEGRVIAIGKHDELIKSCQIYKEIASSQNLVEENI
jgi:ATP-binding cassette subfamily B multidrug efflux pump